MGLQNDLGNPDPACHDQHYRHEHAAHRTTQQPSQRTRTTGGQGYHAGQGDRNRGVTRREGQAPVWENVEAATEERFEDFIDQDQGYTDAYNRGDRRPVVACEDEHHSDERGDRDEYLWIADVGQPKGHSVHEHRASGQQHVPAGVEQQGPPGVPNGEAKTGQRGDGHHAQDEDPATQPVRDEGRTPRARRNTVLMRLPLSLVFPSQSYQAGV